MSSALVIPQEFDSIGQSLKVFVLRNFDELGFDLTSLELKLIGLH